MYLQQRCSDITELAENASSIATGANVKQDTVSPFLCRCVQRVFVFFIPSRRFARRELLFFTSQLALPTWGNPVPCNIQASCLLAPASASIHYSQNLKEVYARLLACQPLETFVATAGRYVCRHKMSHADNVTLGHEVRVVSVHPHAVTWPGVTPMGNRQRVPKDNPHLGGLMTATTTSNMNMLNR